MLEHIRFFKTRIMLFLSSFNSPPTVRLLSYLFVPIINNPRVYVLVYKF